MNNRHILEHAIANAGPISEQQRRAIWAKRGHAAIGAPLMGGKPTPPAGGPLIAPQSGSPGYRPMPLGGLNAEPRIAIGADGARQFVQPMTPPTPQPAAPPQTVPAKTPRQWGESRPGEMYVQVEGPGNPAWEKRHPELAPSGGTVAPPQHHLLDVPPTKTPRGSPNLPYGGDARTVPTPGHPDPAHPHQTPPIIAPMRHGPVLGPPDKKQKAKTPVPKANDWYRRG